MQPKTDVVKATERKIRLYYSDIAELDEIETVLARLDHRIALLSKSLTDSAFAMMQDESDMACRCTKQTLIKLQLERCRLVEDGEMLRTRTAPITRALARLPEAARRLLLNRFGKHKTATGLGNREMSCDPSTVRYRVQKALSVLAAELSAFSRLFPS